MRRIALGLQAGSWPGSKLYATSGVYLSRQAASAQTSPSRFRPGPVRSTSCCLFRRCCWIDYSCWCDGAADVTARAAETAVQLTDTDTRRQGCRYAICVLGLWRLDLTRLSLVGCTTAYKDSKHISLASCNASTKFICSDTFPYIYTDVL